MGEEELRDAAAGEGGEEGRAEVEPEVAAAPERTAEELRRDWAWRGVRRPCPSVSFKQLNERFADFFLAGDELRSALAALRGCAETGDGADAAGGADGAEGDAPAPAPSVSGPDVEWSLPLEAEEGTTAALKISGLRLPYAKDLLRTFLCKPKVANIKLTNGETFWAVGAVAFARFPSEEIARRQRRRLDGAQWPTAGTRSGRLRCEYVDADALPRLADAQAKLVAEGQADPATTKRKPVLSELFQKTEATPRIFYQFSGSDDKEVVRGREAARARIARIRSRDDDGGGGKAAAPERRAGRRGGASRDARR